MQEFFAQIWHFIQAVAAPISDHFLYLWNNGIAGHEVKDIIIALACVLAALAVRRPMAWVIFSWLKKVSQNISNDYLDDATVNTLRGPIRLFPIWFGLAAAVEVLKLPARYQALVDHVELSFGAILFFWVIFSGLRPLSRQFVRLEGKLTRPMISWMTKGLRFLILIVGVAVILNIWGIQIGPILAGLGLLGAAVALGAQDLFKNLIAGVMILTERRFDLGDWISVENVVEGDVERIGFRSTLVRRLDKAAVYVPNSKLADDTVINISRMTQRRIQWTIGLEYRISQAQIDAVCHDVLAYIESNPDFVPMSQNRSFVGLDKFSESSIDILIICFSNKTRWVEYVAVKAALGKALKEILERHGVNFAFPSRSVYVANTSDTPTDNPVVAKAVTSAGAAD